MSDPQDPYAAIAEPSEADPYAGIAEKTATGDPPPPAPKQGAIERFARGFNRTLTGAETPSELWQNVKPALDPRTAGLAVMNFAESMLQSIPEQSKQLSERAQQELSTGHPIKAFLHQGAANVPVLGPVLSSAADKMAGGNVAGGLGEASAIALPFGERPIRAAAELAPRAASAAKDVAMNPVRAVTGTGSRSLRDLVKDTREENVGIDKANTKLTEDRATEVRSHFDKTQVAKEAADRRSAIETRKSATDSGVRTLSDKFQGDLKAVREKAATEADAKYQTLNSKLGKIPGNAAVLGAAARGALQKISGTSETPKIFRDILEKYPESEPDFIEYQGAKIPKSNRLYDVLKEQGEVNSASLTYSDLQGYYSELGRELKRGTLPGDVYTAYGELQDAIGNEMQRIADANGVGPQLTDARTSWRNLKQTFYDPKSPLRKALDAKEAGGAVKALSGKDRTGIEALAKYDPELARRANTIRGYQEEAAGLRVPAESTKAAPQLKPKTDLAPRKTIGQQEVQDAKSEGLQKRADRIRHLGEMAAIWPMFYVIRDVVRGNLPSIPMAGAEMAGTAIAGHSLARVLESPRVADFLTKATERDIAAIPADLRGDFPAIVQKAQEQGVKISPALSKAFIGAVALAPRQHPTDEWQTTP